MTAPDPQAAPVQPVPCQWGVQVVTLSNGQNAVLVQVQTPMGVFAFFMAPDEAVEIGGNITRFGKQASTGLIIPNGAHP